MPSKRREIGEVTTFGEVENGYVFLPVDPTWDIDENGAYMKSISLGRDLFQGVAWVMRFDKRVNLWFQQTYVGGHFTLGMRVKIVGIYPLCLDA